MDKRFIIFIVLAGIILWGSNYFMVKNTKEVVKQATQETVLEGEKVDNDQKEVKKEVKKLDISKKPLEKAKIVGLSNDYLKIEALTTGARINHVFVKRLNDKVDEQIIDLVDESSRNQYLALSAIINNQDVQLNNQNWLVQESQSKLTFYISPVEGLTISKEISLNDDFSGTCTINVDNQTDQLIELRDVKLLWGPGKTTGKDRFNVKQAVALVEGKVERIKPKKKDEEHTFKLINGWAGLTDQYFGSLFYGDNDVIDSVTIKQNSDQSLDVICNLPSKVVEPKTSQKYDIKFYFGPKNYQDLKKYGNDLQKVVKFGIFRVLAIPMYHTLKYFYKVTSNYGLAIILLTIVIRLILWWPTHKSYKSMKKMQVGMSKMQPRLKTLKEVYRDNPQKLNEETMKLYKEYQINPMGGCLPMLLQMPVFFALYATLTAAVELKGASFFWVWKDLSLKDPIYLLPILMGLSMFVQQKMSTPPAATPEAATQQKMMLYFMPIMLTFFAFMWPSGLLLYWVVSNILSIGQQVFINRKA